MGEWVTRAHEFPLKLKINEWVTRNVSQYFTDSDSDTVTQDKISH